MNRWIRIMCGCLLAWSLQDSAEAVPNREPLGQSVPTEVPAIELTRVGKEGAAVFGDWTLWNNLQGGSESFFLINRKTGLTVHMPWTSNGWLNYRTADGTWYVSFPAGDTSPQNRSDLNVAPYLGKPPPAVRLAPGKYIVNNWTVTITPDGLEFQTQNVPARLNFRAHSHEFMHNGRTISTK